LRVVLACALGAIAFLVLPAPVAPEAGPASLAVRALVALAIAACVALAPRLGRWRAAAPLGGLAIVLVAAVWYSGVAFGPLHGAPDAARRAALDRPIKAEAYHFDGEIYLRTRHLMKIGVPYYEAFRLSVLGDRRHDGDFLTSPFNYREPLLFEVWKLLPGERASDVLGWFVVWSLLTLIASFWLASSLAETGVALLAPIVLVRFFDFLWWSDLSWFTLMEVWAVGLGIAALAALLRGRWIASLVLLALAIGVRELMVVLIPAWLVAWWLLGDRARRDQLWWMPVGAVGAPAALLAVHILSVPRLSAGGAGVGAWLHGGLAEFLGALQYGWSASAHGSAPMAFAIVLAALGAALVTRPEWRRGALVAAVAAPATFLLVVSGGISWVYWGAIFTPIAASMAPGLLGRVAPPEAEDN
jgi:hypothetical protein